MPRRGTPPARDRPPTARSETTVLYQSPLHEGCEHQWRPGAITVHPEPLADGTVVLVKRGETVGAFLLVRQTAGPARAMYRWWYGPEFRGRLDTGSPEIVSGYGHSKGEAIAFGPFSVEWSAKSDGLGYVYYPQHAGSHASPSDTLVCVTDLTGIEGVDALDPKWHYKRTPVD